MNTRRGPYEFETMIHGQNDKRLCANLPHIAISANFFSQKSRMKQKLTSLTIRFYKKSLQQHEKAATYKINLQNSKELRIQTFRFTIFGHIFYIMKNVSIFKLIYWKILKTVKEMHNSTEAKHYCHDTALKVAAND